MGVVTCECGQKTHDDQSAECVLYDGDEIVGFKWTCKHCGESYLDTAYTYGGQTLPFRRARIVPMENNHD